jgi:hypothetical protein
MSDRAELMNQTMNLLAQVGFKPSRLNLMIGAKDFITDQKNLSYSFSFPRPMGGGPNRCTIQYKLDDTFTMILARSHGTKYTILKTMDGLYTDQLVRAFEISTKLYLTLR